MEKVLSKPNSGWSSLNLIDKDSMTYSFPLSYIEDIPNMLLSAIEKSFSKSKYDCGDDFSIKFDAEGWNWILVSTEYRTYVITEQDEIKLKAFDLDRKTLVDSLLKCLKKDSLEWANFCEHYLDDYDMELERTAFEIVLNATSKVVEKAKMSF